MGATHRRLHPGGGCSSRTRRWRACGLGAPMDVEQHGSPRHHSGAWRGLAWFLASIAVVVAAVLLGAMIGPAGPPAWRVPLAFLDHLPGVHIDSGVSEAQWSLIWNIRMPRVVLAGIVVAMPSVGGAAYQGVFRNPLVDPYLL